MSDRPSINESRLAASLDALGDGIYCGAHLDIDVFQQAIVRPTVDFGSLELVMVVTNFNPLDNVQELLPESLIPVDEPVEAQTPDADPEPTEQGPESEGTE